MLLEIFVKRKRGGELCTTAFQFSKTLIECKEVKRSEVTKDGTLELQVTHLDGSTETIVLLVSTHGFSLKNSTGLEVAGYVSAIDEEEVEAAVVYNTKELVDFGNFLLSDQRNNKGSEVSHADLCNWQSRPKNIDGFSYNKG